MRQPINLTVLTLAQVKERTQISRSAWYKGIEEGRYPRPIKLGGSSRWLEAEIDKVIEEAADARDRDPVWTLDAVRELFTGAK